jgi:hypothetical protein
MKLLWKCWIAAAILGALLVGRAHAATITTNPMTGHPDTYEVHIDGEIKLHDDIAFKKVVNGLTGHRAIAVLNSPGGNMLAGILIGATIRDQGLTTLVPANTICTSMCSVIWLAGNTRYADLTASIGFHSMGITVGKKSKRHDARAEEGNAFVAEYFKALGLPKQTSTILLAAHPDDIMWLNLNLAKGLEIDFVIDPPLEKPGFNNIPGVAFSPTGIYGTPWL